MDHATGNADVSPRVPSCIPDHVGPYQILRKLGQGGMGAVYEAVHRDLERHVAIKFLRPDFPGGDLVARAIKEARATNRVKHPGLIEVSESGLLPDGSAYIVMELLRGETLGQRLKRIAGPAPVDWSLHIAWQLASTLAATHKDGIIHRDIKPENIMLIADELAPHGERVKLLDFGLAKLHSEAQLPASTITQSQQVLGTPLYMSPEQCRGAGRVDDRTDVYSLGVVLYQMLAGRPPFVGAGVGELIHQHLGAEPPRLSLLNPSLPESVVTRVERLLCKQAAQRPSMRDLAAELAEPSARAIESQASAKPARSDGAPSGTVKDLLADLLGVEPEPESDPDPRSAPSTEAESQYGAPSPPAPRSASSSALSVGNDHSPPASLGSRWGRALVVAAVGLLLALLGWGALRSRVPVTPGGRIVAAREPTAPATVPTTPSAAPATLPSPVAGDVAGAPAPSSTSPAAAGSPAVPGDHSVAHKPDRRPPPRRRAVFRVLDD